MCELEHPRFGPELLAQEPPTLAHIRARLTRPLAREDADEMLALLRSASTVGGAAVASTLEHVTRCDASRVGTTEGPTLRAHAVQLWVGLGAATAVPEGLRCEAEAEWCRVQRAQRRGDAFALGVTLMLAVALWFRASSGPAALALLGVLLAVQPWRRAARRGGHALAFLASVMGLLQPGATELRAMSLAVGLSAMWLASRGARVHTRPFNNASSRVGSTRRKNVFSRV